MTKNPAPKSPLTRERVVTAALAIVDDQGLEALSMRKLAASLGVEAMSLYNHVDGKADLLAGMLDQVAAEIAVPPDDLGWREALRTRAISTYEQFVSRPWAARIWMQATKPSPDRIAPSDVMLRRLRQSGISPRSIYRAYHVLDGYVLGYALQHQDFSYTDEELKKLAREFLNQLPTDQFPDFVEHVNQHLDPSYATMRSFEFGLDMILDGLEALAIEERTT